MRWNPPGRHIQPLGGFFFFFFMCPQGILPGTQGENLSLSSPLHTNQVAPLFSFGRWTPRRKKKTFSFFFSILKKVQVKRLPSGPSTRHFVINPTPPALTTPTSQTTTFWRARKREQWPRECAWPNRRVNSSFVLILLEKGKRGTSKILTSWWRTQNSFERWPTLLCVVFFFGGNTKKNLSQNGRRESVELLDHEMRNGDWRWHTHVGLHRETQIIWGPRRWLASWPPSESLPNRVQGFFFLFWRHRPGSSCFRNYWSVSCVLSLQTFHTEKRGRNSIKKKENFSFFYDYFVHARPRNGKCAANGFSRPISFWIKTSV